MNVGLTAAATALLFVSAADAATRLRAPEAPRAATSTSADAYLCTGDDDLGLAMAISDAGPGGTVALSGDCVVVDSLIMNLADFTLTAAGPRSPASACNATSASTASASLTNVGCGPVIELLSDSSGTTISGLALTNANVEGTQHVVTNGPFARTGCVGGAPALPGPLHQPDNISIVGNSLTSAGGRCVNQYNHNGPPFNDTNACAAFIDSSCSVPGPVGLATGWNISGNACDTVNGTGIFITGNDTAVTGNCITSGDEGIRVQNNACSSVPSVIMFGSAPGASNTLIEGNTINVTRDPAETFYPLAYIGLGYDFFTTVPEIDVCQRNYNTRFMNNCSDIVDPDPDPATAFGFSAGIQSQKESFMAVRNNDFTLGISPVPAGNAGYVSFDTSYSDWEHNRISGAGDYGLLSLNGTEVGSSFIGNEIGLGDLLGGPGGAAVVLDFGIGPNIYVGNSYCEGFIFIGNGVDDNNVDGQHCDAGPAAACGSSALTFEMLQAKTSPASFTGRIPAPAAAQARIQDRVMSRELLDYDSPRYELQGQSSPGGLSSTGAADNP